MFSLIGYYRKFFPIYSYMIRPLNELTKKNAPFKWTKVCQKSLDNVKQVITTNPILVYHLPFTFYQSVLLHYLINTLGKLCLFYYLIFYALFPYSFTSLCALNTNFPPVDSPVTL